MEQIFVFVEKLLGILTSQRFITTLAGLLVAGVVMFNLVMPLFTDGFDGLDVPDEEALAANIAAFLSQAAVAITFFIGVFRALGQLVDSFQSEPPSLKREAWEARKAR